MKKNYTAPKATIVMIEIQNIIAASPTYGVNNVTFSSDATAVDNTSALGREDDMSFGWSSSSLFDDEEE